MMRKNSAKGRGYDEYGIDEDDVARAGVVHDHTSTVIIPSAVDVVATDGPG
jgi:hypothetical protein